MRIALLIGASSSDDSDVLLGPTVRVPAGTWKVITEGEFNKFGVHTANDIQRFSPEQPFVLTDPTTLLGIVTQARGFSAYLEQV